MAKQGKRLKEISSNLEEGRVYDPSEAVELAKKGAVAKFDETVELHLKTAADPRHADQQLRGVAVLPHGTATPRQLELLCLRKQTLQSLPWMQVLM